MNSVADIIHLIASNVWIYGGSFLLVLSILVFVHEMGHYLVARWCGVRVESFSIGFGREIWGRTDRRGTRWKVSLVPLGGYVKLFGDVDPASAAHKETVETNGGAVRSMTAEERKVAFFSQTVGRRAAIVFAGPAINYIFAIFIMALLFIFYGQPVTPPYASGIIIETAAEKAGFQPNDVVLSIDGKPIQRFEEIRREVAIRLDTPMTFKVRRGDKEIVLHATPNRLESKDEHGFQESRGFLGIISPGNGLDIKAIRSVDGIDVKDLDHAHRLLLERMDKTFHVRLDRGPTTDELVVHPLAEKNEGLRDPKNETYNALIIASSDSEAVIRHGILDGIGQAVVETWNNTVGTLQALGQIVTGNRSAKELGGIIRIGAMAGDMAKNGMIALVSFMALLSINLGLINLFPIPMLDGGHLVFYALEAIRGRPVPEQIQEYAFRLGLAILVGIMVFANLNDIIQLNL